MLDLNRLRILRAVVASGSVNDTAARLGLTPSTVSQHIHTLEREFGFTLDERVGRGIQATPAAIELAGASADVLHAMADLDAFARGLRDGTTAKLTMRAFASAAYTWMPEVTRTLRQELPEVALELSIIASESADPVGQADVEVHTEAPQEVMRVPATHHRIELGTDDYVVALPTDHQLAGTREAELGSFSAEDWVHYDFDDDIGTQIVAEACAGAGFSPRYVARAEDHVSGLALVAAGVGIALVPGLVVEWSAFNVAYVRPRNPTPQRRIVALVRNRTRANPASQQAVALLSALGGRLGAERQSATG